MRDSEHKFYKIETICAIYIKPSIIVLLHKKCYSFNTSYIEMDKVSQHDGLTFHV